MTPAARAMRVAGQQVRYSSNLPIPPKLATPESVSGGAGVSNTNAVVDFYKALPKGNEPQKHSSSIKSKYFNGKNASGKPLVFIIGFLMVFGYTLEYNGHLTYALRKDRAAQEPLRTVQAVREYLPSLLGLYNSILTDAVLVHKPLVFSWQSRAGVYKVEGLDGELSMVLFVYATALSNECARIVESLGPYELDPTLAVDANRAKEERLKAAIDLLCRASGIFALLTNDLIPRLASDTSRPPELTSAQIQALARVAMAEAHRLAVRKLQAPALTQARETLTPGPPLPKEHPSASLLAKIHVHTASLYEQASTLVCPPVIDHPLGKVKATMRSLKPVSEQSASALQRYLVHEAKWHRALAHKWFGIDAGENAQQTGAGVAHLTAAKMQLAELVPKNAAPSAPGKETQVRIPLWEQRRAARFRGDLALWWAAMEMESVVRWQDVYKRLNDKVAFQCVPAINELVQGGAEGRAVLVQKPFVLPRPAYGPGALGAEQGVAHELLLGMQTEREERHAYAGAGAYY
ncbi:hypothetical protein MVES_002440 [Malassezia vespertilionis]|uniref:pH-response regulator protein palC n=1 Tax=Malassezia vespertilionis TaxID=2020962 RepID=A0A2N1JAJ4_9BASI|nr:hypothetical protein MVES_002440 [Malassezia vespertilionis]